jgi:tRNA(His) 5'-end guanylyltransferase
MASLPDRELMYRAVLEHNRQLNQGLDPDDFEIVKKVREQMGREKDPTGDRLKVFEKATEVVLDPTLPMILRLDGRAFHSYTKQFDRPFDERLHRLMARTMLALAEETNARYCYTQSDEITLVCLCEGKAQPLFGGRVQKLTSLMASYAGAFFNREVAQQFRVPVELATFDCRAYTVPDKATAAEVVLWREADAIRNSTLGRGQEFLSPKNLHGMSAKDVRAWLANEGKPWGALEPERKFGVAYQRKTVSRPFSCAEIEQLPEKHAARTNPDLTVQRQDFVEVPLPLRWRCYNPEAVIFDGADVIPFTGERADVLMEGEP